MKKVYGCVMYVSWPIGNVVNDVVHVVCNVAIVVIVVACYCCVIILSMMKCG